MHVEPWVVYFELLRENFLAKTFERKIKLTLDALVSFSVAQDQGFCDARFLSGRGNLEMG